MLFTSITFLYCFLPILLLVYFVAAKKYRNYILLVFSLFFYAWGEPKFVFLMIFSIIINYFIGLKIDKKKSEDTLSSSNKAKIYLTIGILFNLCVLGYFKYINFIFDNINRLFNTTITYKQVALPIGISFFTFQAMSYIIDVYRRDGKVQKKLSGLMLYIALFPQLIAGPIVRYSTVDDQIRERQESTSKFAEGINRFILGLGKKILLANNMAVIADRAFNAVGAGTEISTGFAWAGILCYTLQIYFDFSGYSDMAIGLGKMFGFEFLENFNYPYISKSVGEFWRRWHISLGSWFRDYVYIPLGGNRRSTGRNILNLCVVWFLTGLWHGANWTFILWGCYFGAFIIFERYILKNKMDNINGYVRMAITFFIAVLGWVLFRAENLQIAIEYYKRLFSFNTSTLWDSNMNFFVYEYGLLFFISLLAATPLFKNMVDKVFVNKEESSIYFTLEMLFLMFIMYIATAHLITSDFNPFIYFNF